MPRIYIREPNHFYTYELPVVPGGEVVVGSAPTCQLALPGVNGLSSTHARIVCQPQGYVIEDLHSQYGTLQNGRPVQSEYMQPGLEYMLGAACITLEPVAAAQPAQPVQPSPTAVESAKTGAAPETKKSPAIKRPGTGVKGANQHTDISQLAKKFDRSGSKRGSAFTFVYVVIILLLALYAGIALRHWERTGNFLPGIQADGK